MNKRMLLAIGLCCVTLFLHAQTGILMVHYGTQNQVSREKTIEVMDSLVKHRFPTIHTEIAYLAPAIIRNLEKKGVYRQTVCEAMSKLIRQGCKDIIVQSSLLLDGTMLSALKDDVNLFSQKVNSIHFGKPLITTNDDITAVLNIIHQQVPHQADEQIVLVGHGTADAANAMYSQIAYHAQYYGPKDMQIGTIEGFPTLQDVSARIRENGKKKLILVPLLFIAGNHQKEDIEGIWKPHFKQLDYTVTVWQHGLGEYPLIQERILSNITELLNEVHHE